MATKPETQFRKKVRADLQDLVNADLPIFFDAIQQKTICGSPDFYLCLKGYFFALELKDIYGVVSPLQRAKHELIALAEGWAVVADQSNWHSVLQMIIFILKDTYETEGMSKN